MRRLRTATRASSPIRPGRTALANSPTENAEKTSGKPGWGGGIACTTTFAQGRASRLVLEQADERLDKRPLVTCREGDGGLLRHDLTVPIDVGRDHRGRARVRARQHHAEALPAERGRNERFGAQQLRREL